MSILSIRHTHTILDPGKHRAGWKVLFDKHASTSWYRYALMQSIRDLKVEDTLTVPSMYFVATSVRALVNIVAKEWDGRRKFACNGVDGSVRIKRVK